MHPRIPLVLLAVAAVIGRLTPIASAQAVSFAGVWTLNRTLTQIPKEMGFNVVAIPANSGGGQSTPSGAGDGRRGGGDGGSRAGSVPGGGLGGSRESYDGSQRRQLLTNEARNPSPWLVITESPGVFTIVDDQQRTRALSTTAVQQSLDLRNITIAVSTTNIHDRYIVVYDVEQDRKVRYTYSRLANPPQLIVDIEFIERGGPGDKARLVYEPGSAAPATPPPVTAAPTTSAASASGAPTASGRPSEIFDQRPGAELKGLKSLGVVVEELGSQAIACGLNQGAIEAAISKRLTAGGLTVRRNSDDDTYLYVNIKTDRLPDATCLSRYDSSLYTHTTAKLFYGDRPVLVQVELMHRGGMNHTSGQHASAIIRQLESDADLFVTQIRTANQ